MTPGSCSTAPSQMLPRKAPGFTQFSVLFHAACAIAFAAIVVALLTKEFLNVFSATGFGANGNHIIW
ncbi:hypothetical protein QP922_05635 [Corynebacterium sp. MSK218]|uniref:hypothetical protein n=1 Tax=Corynebacterium sp. MSK218 TaxID=3050218 RepID=UPI00254BBAF9|nr:hypothetical protein [Corynebacterium sp. MSK218]MDK8763301.1 hypothetical protein [Corynebacterium sp. MSK218]